MVKLLEKSRYLSIIGIVSLLLASLAAFLWGAVKTTNTLVTIVSSIGQDPYITVALIELMDSFLIATGLFIFAISLFELFIARLPLPAWMLAHNLQELKEKMGGIIILVMAVKFLEHLVEWKDPLDSLFFAIAMAVVSAALIALDRFGGTEHPG